MAGVDFFDIHIRATGSHAAMPHQSVDPIVIGGTLVSQLQTIVSRNVSPTDSVVLSVTQIHAGAAYNVIPSDCTLSGTLRYFDNDLRDRLRSRVRDLCDGVAHSYGIEVEVDIRNIFDVLVNDQVLSNVMLAIAGDVVGHEKVTELEDIVTGSEDFADMLRVVPGAYCTIGHAGTLPLHNDGFMLDESMLPVGASIYAKIIEQRTTSDS
jgi:hippurate hydrolase